MKFISHSAEETRKFGKRLAEQALPGQIYALNGNLGAGKTVFAQGFAQGLGVKDPVNSPTFTILQVYEDGRLPFYHFDVYRIEDPDEMEEIGFDDYLNGDGVCLIEWADEVRELLPKETIRITIQRDREAGDDVRTITLKAPAEYN